MIYADTDFFLAIMKESDWLKAPANCILKKYQNRMAISPIALTELLLLAARYELDPKQLLVDVLEIAELHGATPEVYLLAAHFMAEEGVGVFDALHAAVCSFDRAQIISSDKIFDRLGIERIGLGGNE